MAKLRTIVLLLMMLATVVLLGATGYMIIEDWAFIDGLYMTVITIATVGFREVSALSPAGRVYTILVILVGVGVMGFTLSNFTAFLVSGKIREFLRAGKMQKKISKLKRHYIVCGAGRMGYEAIRELLLEKQDIVIIERDPEIIQKLEDEGVPTIRGDATDDETLRVAGVEHAKGLLAALPNDADNVYVSLSAKEMNPKLFIIARGADNHSEDKLIKAGADRVILPYQIGGRRMAAVLCRPEIVDFLDVMMGKDELSLRMEIVEVAEKSALIEQTLKDSNIRRETDGALVMGLIRAGGEMIANPTSDMKILNGDQLLVLGRLDQIQKLEKIAS